MIAASEPLEFVPHGRTVLANHPGQIYGKHNSSVSETSLLYKLTNFAIKDESLLVDREEEREWWCVREVFYRVTGETDEDTSPQRDTKDYNSESFRPLSRLKNDFNISLKSELLKKVDPESAGPSRTSSANSSSNMSKKFNLNSGSKKGKQKPLNPKTDCSFEEELYVKGCTAIWSKGLISTPGTKISGPETRETIACYTIENPIKHAAFVNFHVNIKNTMLIDALNSQIGDVKKNIKIEDTTDHIKTEIMPSIVLLDSKCMRVYATDGREYITSVPFQVKKIWPMKFGLLIEKDATPIPISKLPTSFIKQNDSQNSTFNRSRNNNLFNLSGKLRMDSISTVCEQDIPLPTCFSLTHPLDEVSPILMKSPSQGLQYYNDGDLQIMFVSTNPSIILLYDWKTGIHSLWRIRTATRDECLSMCPNMNTTTFSQTCDYIGSPMQSNRNATSWVTGLGSPYQSRKGLNTPSRSRINSPMANIFHQQGMSPHASIGQASSTSMMGNTMMQSPPTLPLYPDICIDHIWTDNIAIRRDSIENDNDMKTFLHTDLVGHDFLCFLVKSNSVSKLQILRLQKSHYHGQSNKTNLMVGTVSTVFAKDAEVLPHLNMFALVDEAGNIILQSGNNVVGKVHVGGVLARLIDSPYTKRSTFQSPFPKRSSLLPSRCDTTFDDSALHLLSPVPHSTRVEPKETLGVCGVRDAAGNRLTLVLESGGMFRVGLPPPASSALLSAVLRALHGATPADITMQVMIKWYGVRNSPGTQDLTPQQEWTMFSNLLLTLIGYDTDRLTKQSEDEHTETASKKQRTSSDGSQDDWDYLLNSKLHKTIGNSMTCMLKLPQNSVERKHKFIIEDDEKPVHFNGNSVLFPHIMQVLYSFHLLYEEIKLNTLLSNDLKPLVKFLYQLAKDLKLEHYVNHYWLDFPTEFSIDQELDSCIPDEAMNKLVEPSYFTKEPPSIFSYLNSMFRDIDVGFYPYMVDVNVMSKDLIEILSLVDCGRNAGVQTITGRSGLRASTPRRAPAVAAGPAHCRALMHMCDRGFTPQHIASLPPALGLAVLGVVCLARGEAWPWGREACALLMREELALHNQITEANTDEQMESLALGTLEKETAFTTNNPTMEEPQYKNDDAEAYTGMEHLNTKLLSLLYPRDHRMTEVINMLQSSQPVTINLTQRPEVSDHDFIEEQEKYLYALSTRTMALPIGRGMVTLRSQGAWSGGGGVVPRVCVWGRGGGGTGGVAAPTELAGGAGAWPAFHSAAGAALALVPQPGAALDAAWLHNNRPQTLQGGTELSPELAGFLLALGLNGHLKEMPFMNIYEYLVKCNEMVSIGLLLGLAATYRGTMDVQATKLLSIHVEALLPATSVELDIHQNILVAALLAVGLLYHDTHHNHYAQMLLNEIGKPSGSEAEQCVEREGYALAGGLALGMVMVGAGNSAPPHLAPTLRGLMLAGEHTHSGSGSRRSVNLDVVSPGATLALGLIYLRTNNRAVASWLDPPATAYSLDAVRPDLLMLRHIARGLIMWDEIEASEEWIESQVPETIRPYCFVKPTEDNIDYEAMNQAYCNTVGGACIAMGIRFAGSGCIDARDAALGAARRLLGAGSKPVAELAGRATIEACIAVCLLSAAMIMAGRGDLEVLRMCRRLRVRVPAGNAHSTHPPLTHGGQMCVSMSVGLAFLAGGRGTLGTSKMATAALLAAFFPKFPTHTEDNRYHLQAFRHLYVLAVEPRLILPRDLDTGKLCYAHIQVVDLAGAVQEMKAPCIIPELNTLQEVRINDPRYWPVCFHRDRNWDQLQTFLQYTWCIDLQQRAGCLSYRSDPHGFRTLLARSLTLDPLAHAWTTTPDNIELFTNDEHIINLISQHTHRERDVCPDCLPHTRRRRRELGKGCTCRRYTLDELEYVQGLSTVTYDCLLKDMLAALPMYIPTSALSRYTLDELEYVQGLSTVTYDCLLKDMLAALPMYIPTSALSRYTLDELEYVQGLSTVTYDCLLKDMLAALPMYIPTSALSRYTLDELEYVQGLSTVTYDCLLKDMLAALPMYIPTSALSRYTLDELEYVQGLSTVTYDCLLKDMLAALPMWTAFLKIIRTLKTEPTTQNVWQIKLLLSLIEKQNKNTQNKMKTDEEEPEPLISTEFTIAIKQKVCHIFDSLELKLTPYFRKYLGLPSSRKLVTCDENTLKSLSAYITYHDLEKNMLKNSINKDELSILLSRETEGMTTTAESWSKLGELVR